MRYKSSAKFNNKHVPALSLMILACLVILTILAASPDIPSASAQRVTKASKPTLIPNSKKYRLSGLQPATGRSGSASLTARALLGKDGKTDVEATTGELDGTATPPGNINKVQLKPLDQDGEVMYARNFTGLTGGGYFKTTVDDLARGKQVQVQTNVGGIDAKRTDIVTVVETVKLRPDLAASHLTAPEKAVVNARVNISAVIREINADAGATANCVLYVDGVRVDQINGLWVDTGGTVSAAFTHTFTSVGAKRVEVKVENVMPGDYDLSNNTVSGPVEVTQPGSKLNYDAAFFDIDFFHRYKESFEYSYNGVLLQQWSDERGTEGWTQGSWMYGYTPRAVSFPLNAALTESNDGETVFSTSFSAVADSEYSSSDETYQGTQKCTSNFDPTTSAHFFLCTYSLKEIATGNVVEEWTYLYTGRGAGDVVYYSKGFSNWWHRDGTLAHSYSWNDSGHDIFGGRQPLGTERGINLSITSGDGEVFTASPVMTLQPYNFTNQQPYTCWSWSEGGRNIKSCLELDVSHVGKIGSAYEDGNP